MGQARDRRSQSRSIGLARAHGPVPMCLERHAPFNPCCRFVLLFNKTHYQHYHLP